MLKVIRCGTGLQGAKRMQEAVKARRGAQARVKKTVPASRSHGTRTQARTEHHTTSHRTTTSRLLVAVRTPGPFARFWFLFWSHATHCARQILRITTPSLSGQPNVVSASIGLLIATGVSLRARSVNSSFGRAAAPAVTRPVCKNEQNSKLKIRDIGGITQIHSFCEECGTEIWTRHENLRVATAEQKHEKRARCFFYSALQGKRRVRPGCLAALCVFFTAQKAKVIYPLSHF